MKTWSLKVKVVSVMTFLRNSVWEIMLFVRKQSNTFRSSSTNLLPRLHFDSPSLLENPKYGNLKFVREKYAVYTHLYFGTSSYTEDADLFSVFLRTRLQCILYVSVDMFLRLHKTVIWLCASLAVLRGYIHTSMQLSNHRVCNLSHKDIGV